MTRILVLCAKGDEDSVIAEALRKVEALAAGTEGLGAAAVVSSRDDYTATAKDAGSWDAWVHGVVNGVDPTTREPRYHWYVAAGNGMLGRANALIVEGALSVRKPVYWLRPNGSAAIVSGVQQLNKGFKNSHKLMV